MIYCPESPLAQTELDLSKIMCAADVDNAGDMSDSRAKQMFFLHMWHNLHIKMALE